MKTQIIINIYIIITITINLILLINLPSNIKKELNKQNYNFAKQYPFETVTKPKGTKTNLIIQKLKKTPKIIDNLLKESFPKRETIAEIQSAINKTLGVNLFLEFGYTYFLNNKYLAYNYPYRKPEMAINAIKELNIFCKQQDINFSFILYPCKNCKYDPQLPPGIKDNNNKTADELILNLIKQDINCFDLRNELFNNTSSHYENFFVTDHHWKPSTGLWSAKKIVEKLNCQYNLNINTELLSKENFNIKTLENQMFGSQGKKVTMAYAQPENLEIITPKYYTKFNRVSPTWSDAKGRIFKEVMFEYSHINPINYYHKDAYAYYSNGDLPFVKYENLLANTNLKILWIRDSFSRVVTPFIALCVKDLFIIDPRYFNGSIETLIKTEKPDLVILAYEASCVSVGSANRWQLK